MKFSIEDLNNNLSSNEDEDIETRLKKLNKGPFRFTKEDLKEIDEHKKKQKAISKKRVEEDAIDDDDKIESPGRRQFLKRAAMVVGAVATGVGTKEFLTNNKSDKKTEQKEEIIKNEVNIVNSEPVEKKEAQVEKEKNIADFYLDAYYEIAKTELWQKEILTETLFIAQQLQESGYQQDAKSSQDAVGVMQVRGISVKDVTKYLAKLKGEGIIKYNGPEELDEEQVKEIKRLIMEDKLGKDYGRALGKIYMVMLSDYKYGYGVAETLLKKKEHKKAQKEILAAYNGGIGNITFRKKGEKIRRTKPENKWPRESRNYYKKIFNYDKIIENIKQSFIDKGLEVPNNKEIKDIALKMNKFNSKDRYVMLEKYVKRIKDG